MPLRFFPFPLRPVMAGLVTLAVAGCALQPDPVTEKEAAERMRTTKARLYSDQAPVDGPISLSEAMARAVKYNLDHRLKMMEKALKLGQADVARWDLLPRVTANAGYTSRGNEAGSNSKSLLTGEESLESSTSRERSYETADLSLAWNVLDFGVSYLNARQQANRRLIAEQERRKTVHNICRDVRHAYWRVVAAQRLLPRLDDLKDRMESALAKSREAERRELVPAEKALSDQMSLLKTLRRILQLKRDLVSARSKLASLMNLPPDTDYEVVEPDGGLIAPSVPDNLPALRNMALMKRPEVRKAGYKKRVTVDEANKELLRLLPGLELSASRQYSGNEFLYNQYWVEGGLKLTWNLMRLASAPARMDRAEARREVAQTRRLSMAAAAVTQVNVAWVNYHQALEDYDLASKVHNVAQKRKQRAEDAERAEGGNGLKTIQRESKAVFARMQRATSYADLQNALGRLYASVGARPFPEDVQDADLEPLAEGIAEVQERWRRGRMSIPEAAKKAARKDDGAADTAGGGDSPAEQDQGEQKEEETAAADGRTERAAGTADNRTAPKSDGPVLRLFRDLLDGKGAAGQAKGGGIRALLPAETPGDMG